MNPAHLFRHPGLRALATLALSGAALMSAPAQAAGKADPALVAYQQQRAVCMSGQSNQDRETCLREAGAARDEARRNGLDKGTAVHADNALAHCKALPADEARACAARMRGAGSTSGSVAAGGIYRELVTREAAPVQPATPAAPASPAAAPAPACAASCAEAADPK